MNWIPSEHIDSEMIGSTHHLVLWDENNSQSLRRRNPVYIFGVRTNPSIKIFQNLILKYLYSARVFIFYYYIIGSKQSYFFVIIMGVIHLFIVNFLLLFKIINKIYLHSTIAKMIDERHKNLYSLNLICFFIVMPR